MSKSVFTPVESSVELNVPKTSFLIASSPITSELSISAIIFFANSLVIHDLSY